MRYFVYLDSLIDCLAKAFYDPIHHQKLTDAQRIAMYDDLRMMFVKAHKEHGFITMYQMTVLLEKLEDAIQ